MEDSRQAQLKRILPTQPGAILSPEEGEADGPCGLPELQKFHLDPPYQLKVLSRQHPFFLIFHCPDANASSLNRHRKICGTALPRHPCLFCETTFTHGMAVLTVANTSVPNATEPTLTELSKNFSKPHKPNYNVSAQLVTPSL